MNEILDNVEELKNLIINSSEYKKYDNLTKELEKDQEINEIIDKIKDLQKDAVNKEFKNENKDLVEQELDILFEKLNNNKKYMKYIKASKELNKLITKIQDNFSENFNDILC